MKRILFFLTFVISFQILVAQPPNRFERVEALRVAYITEYLKLTPEEAQLFWPVFKKYDKEIKEVRKEYKDDELKFQEEALNIRKKYKADFKKILVSDERVNKVFKADAEFRDLVKRELQKRMQNRRGQNLPPQQ